MARLPGAVAEALRVPSRHAERRRHYARLLFGELMDGQNPMRVAERILALPTADASRAALVGPVGGPSWAWHDLRSRLSMSPVLRRLVLGPLEVVRLRVRGWVLRRHH